MSNTTTDQLLQSFTGATNKIISNGAAVFTNSWGPMAAPFDAQSYQAGFVSAAQQLASQGRSGLGVAR